MVKNLTEDEIFRFITGDFEGVWNSVAANSDASIGRGNFLFARQAMNLLEFAGRLCASDSSGLALLDFSQELQKIERRYFTILPSLCVMEGEFRLPYVGRAQGDILLWVLFDLIRHGLAHQYQQILVELKDRKHLFVELTGPGFGRDMNSIRRSRSQGRLGYYIDYDGDVGVKVYPDMLFLDFVNAMNDTMLLRRGLNFTYLTRPTFRRTRQKGSHTKPKLYDFDSSSLLLSLNSAGHHRITI